MAAERGVLVGVDGSVDGWAALDWAAADAARLGDELTVVYVLEGWPEMDLVPREMRLQGERKAGKVVDAAVERLRRSRTDVAVRTRWVPGNPPAELVRLAEEADRVVLGSGGQGGLGGLLRGSVARYVANRTTRPTVVVRGVTYPTGPVAVGVSGSPAGEAALAYAFSHAARRGMAVRALHVHRAAVGDPMAPLTAYDPGGDAMALVRDAVAPWAAAYPEVMVECAAVAGSPAQRLVQVSAGSSLVVVGCRRRAGLLAAARGTVGRALVGRSRCPVAFAR